jgi:hypothetical protein
VADGTFDRVIKLHVICQDPEEGDDGSNPTVRADETHRAGHKKYDSTTVRQISKPASLKLPAGFFKENVSFNNLIKHQSFSSTIPVSEKPPPPPARIKIIVV